MNQFFVRWLPPYSSAYKEQPCAFIQEARMMRDWFRSIGVVADVISRSATDTIVD